MMHSDVQALHTRRSLLTLHVVQVRAGEHLGLRLVGGHLLVDGHLQGHEAADAHPLPQVVAAPLGPGGPAVGRPPPEPAAGRRDGDALGRPQGAEGQGGRGKR